jgi:hypothetical protein
MKDDKRRFTVDIVFDGYGQSFTAQDVQDCINYHLFVDSQLRQEDTLVLDMTAVLVTESPR